MPDDIMSACTSTKEMARIVGVSRQMLERLEENGCVKRAGTNTWLVVATLQGALRHARSQRSDKSAAEARLRDAKARAVELAIAQKEHRLFDGEETIAALDNIGAVVNEGWNGFAASVTRDMELRRKIDAAIAIMKGSVSARLAAIADNLRRTGKAE
jgi:hypothetical protein